MITGLTAAILFTPIAATSFENVGVAVIAAVASIVNTLILVWSGRRQRAHREISEQVGKDVGRLAELVRGMKVPLDALREIGEEREQHIDELRGLNRAFANRAIELRSIDDAIRTFHHGLKEGDK